MRARLAIVMLIAAIGGAAGCNRKQPAPPAFPPAVANAEVFKVPLGGGPTRGGTQPKVTIVEFADFECSYCARVQATLRQILDTYGADVQLVFRHDPLAFHAHAFAAALVAEAARAQGKFWEMHDKLYANQQALDTASLERYAQELGLDVARVKRALDGEDDLKDRVGADAREAERFGVNGTPVFFINGRPLRGAKPFDQWKVIIDQEIQRADLQLAAGVRREDLYAAVTRRGLDRPAAPPSNQPPARSAARAPQPEAGVAYPVELGSAPAKGARGAPVTIVQFSDYQCPFCSRVEPVIDRLMEEYNGKVRVVWKDLPLAMHPNAMQAALAARAAGAQGKFWPMHDKLFANQQALTPADLRRYAADLHLDPARFERSVTDEVTRQAVLADTQQASRLGVSGTPAFFINGVYLSGARPYEVFAARVEEELRKVRIVRRSSGLRPGR
jgi:protein-disulfide isomerase